MQQQVRRRGKEQRQESWKGCFPRTRQRPSTTWSEKSSVGLRRPGESYRRSSRFFGIAAVDAAVIQDALRLSLADFEDAVTAAAASSAGCEYILTRDPKGFRGSPVQCLTPEAVIPLLSLRTLLT